MEKGNHIIVDLFDVSAETFQTILGDSYIDFHHSIQNIIKSNGMTLVNYIYKDFLTSKGAFTSLYLLAESHISFHTWPENNYIAIDVFTCGECNIDNLVNDIQSILNPGKVNKLKIKRGIVEGFS